MTRPPQLANAQAPSGDDVVPIVWAEAVDERMKRDGFPELELLWKRFRRMNVAVSQLDYESIGRLRKQHMKPLLGWPRSVTAILFLLTAAVIWCFLPTTRGGLGWSTMVLCGLYFLAGPFLGIMLLTWVQRRIVVSLDAIMALDTALMLTRPNYRRVVASTTEALHVAESLRTMGVCSLWDDPNYRATYAKGADGVEEASTTEGLPFVLQTLRAFIGQKDEVRREFVAGRYTPYLKAGKASVTEFIACHQGDVQQLKAGTLGMDAAIDLLKSLRAYVSEGSPGRVMLDELIESAESGTFLTAGQLRAEIWQRDPWVDLTHQQEFYSSASLRGVHWMGRSTKGRLGTFGYLRNTAISSLDLRSRKQRLVRCRMVAMQLAEGRDARAVLFVDGVEGTNAVPPEVVERAVTDYAQRCGFGWVAYNARVHNQIPRRFLRHLAARGERARQLDLTIVGPVEREYLDAFGTPLEPFEYAQPRGAVLAYVHRAQACERQLPGREPSVRHFAHQWVRMNCLWIVLALSLILLTTIAVQSAPLLLAVFTPLVALGLWLHFRYQKKSLKAVNES